MITQEMEKWFKERTNRHINLVCKYLDKFNRLTTNKFYEYINVLKSNHDLSKFKEPEYIPYIYVTWDYYCKDNNIEFQIPKNIKTQMNDATFHHIKNNSHHPEYWDKTLLFNPINPKDRDKPSDMVVYAYDMEPLAIVEMCCDWCAVSEERKNNPNTWATMNINKRWMFRPDQVRLIYDTIKQLWEE